MKSTLRKKIDEEYYQSINLKNIGVNAEVKFEVAQEIREKRDKHFDKYRFFKNLNKALTKKEEEK